MKILPLILLPAALGLAPFLNGAVEEWAWGGLAAALAVASCATLFAGRNVAEPRGRCDRPTAAETAWWILLILLAAAQIVPLPRGLLALLAPARAELAAEVDAITASDPNTPPPVPLSVHPEATAMALAQIVSLAALFHLLSSGRWNSREGGTGTRNRNPILAAFVLVATVESALVIVQYAARLAGSSRGLPFGLGTLTGSYFNKNGMGNLIATALPVTAALLLEGVLEAGVDLAAGAQSKRGPEQRGRRWLAAVAGRGAVAGPAFALTVQVAGLALSLSRGAMAAGGAALGLLTLLVATRWRTRVRLLAAVGAPVVLALLVGAAVGFDRVLGSWASLDADQQAGRVEWWETAWRVFLANAGLGTGLGTFLDASGAHRTGAQAGLHVAHAHNDYAEAAATMGVPGLLLALSALLLLAARLRQTRRNGDLAALGAGTGLAAFALHAFVDFPLGFSANVAWAVALWAVVAGRRNTPEEELPAAGTGTRFPFAARFLRVAFPVAAAAAAIPPLLAAMADPALEPVRDACREIRRSGRLPPWVQENDIPDKPAPAARRNGGKEKPPAAAPGATVESLVLRSDRATGLTFRAGEAWRWQGTLQRFRAGRVDESGRPTLGEEEEAHAWRRAVTATANALRLRPAVGETHLEYAAALAGAAGAGILPAADVRARADRAALLAGRLAPAAARVAAREADYWLRRARATGGEDESAREDRKAHRERAQAAYRRLLGLDGIGNPAFHLRDAWRRGGSTEFLAGCVPGAPGERADRLYLQAAKLVAASAPVAEADTVLIAWRRWRVDETGRRLAAGDVRGALQAGAVFAPPRPGEPGIAPEAYRQALAMAGKTATAGVVAPGGGESPPARDVRLAGLTVEPGRETSSTFSAEGTVTLEVEGETAFTRPPGHGANWMYNPCLLLEVEIDGLLALQTFLPADADTAAKEGWSWAGLPPPPYRARVQLGTGAHRLTLRCRSAEDVPGGGRPSGLQRGVIRALTVKPG